MQFIIVLFILLSGGPLSQAQLNYEGNPLTETIDYTAQESQSSRLKAKQDYQRFGIADARELNFSQVPFVPSAIDPLPPGATKATSLGNDDNERTRYEDNSKKSTIEEIHLENGSPLTEANNGVKNPTNSALTSEPATSIEALPGVSFAKFATETPAETRQLREYPIQPVQAKIHQSISQEKPQAYPQPSRNYVPPEQSSITQNLAPNPSAVAQQASGQALSQFLNSRTPKESEIALQSYLEMREQAAAGSVQQSPIVDDQTRPRDVNQRSSNVRDMFDNEISTGVNEHQNSQQHMERTLPIALSQGSGRIVYPPRQIYQQQYPPSRWNQVVGQSRREGLMGVPPMRRYPLYRGPMRPYASPWARVAPGPAIYHQKGPMFTGPPGLPVSVGHSKQPIEVIYTRPPGSINPSQIPPSNPPVVHEDASKWFPDSDHPPPQKDVYYSQLYAQSYDPHYYNYIAKTGKIKPWLYGKLGKNEEKSIWWELFSGFKKHGMKNMMNPMFLLGMTIPTLTIMLSALVQKRSIGRSADAGIYGPEEFIAKYEPQIRGALLAYEKQLEEIRLEGGEDRKLRKRSIGPAPPGVFPFEEYFLSHQEEFAQAILAHEKELEKEKIANDKIKEQERVEEKDQWNLTS